MRNKFIPLITMLMAGLVTCLICILKPIDTLHSLIYLLIILVIFYVIGSIAKVIIDKVVEKANLEAEERANHEEYLKLKELEEREEAEKAAAEAEKAAARAEGNE